MAIMYPKGGPVNNASVTAEPTIYHLLAQQLSDDFVVIHSITWLAQVAKEVDGRNVPTGEIDFLILHQALGVLALEVKGGRIRYEHNMAVLPNGDRFDPVAQVRRGIHGLAQWIFKASNISHRIGYGIVFPQSIVKGRSLPPSLLDMTSGTPQSICLDQQDLTILGNQVQRLMHYWQTALKNRPLSQDDIKRIVKLLLPDPDFTPTWIERFEITRQKHLRLTPQQAMRLQQIEKHSRFVLTGRSGTGKTLLAVEYAQRLFTQGKRVLFLAYNVALTSALRKDLKQFQRAVTPQGPFIHVHTYHELCRFAANQLGRTSEYEKGKQWYTTLSHRAFHDAVQGNHMTDYDALVIDEGQVFHQDWLADLEHWFAGKLIFLCCDETQSFAYEHKTSADEIATIIHAPPPFILTYNMRSPRPIFDRLQKVIPSRYEQQSLRDDEANTLEEIICITDPLEQLHQVIEQLQKDQIPSEHIMVIYWNKPPTYRDGFERLVGQTISVYKCRGVEAPVVIVWCNSDPIDDITWACAYSRATDRCIAIYQPFTFLRHYNDQQFAQVIVSSNPHLSRYVHKRQEEDLRRQHMQTEQEREVQEQRALWPSPAWQLVSFPSHILQWSRSWRAWYLPQQPTAIETLLWAMHVATTAPYQVFAEGRFYGRDYQSGYRYIREFFPSTKLTSIRHSDIPIAWCTKCQSWARGQHLIMSPYDVRWQCYDCKREVRRVAPEDDEKEVDFNAVEQWQAHIVECYTIFSMGLFYWSELSAPQKSFVEQHCHNVDDPLNWVARIITATEVLALLPGALVEIETIHRLSWTSCPWLTTKVDETEWLKALTLGMRIWARYKAIRKRTKGVYEVLDLHLHGDQEEGGR